MTISMRKAMETAGVATPSPLSARNDLFAKVPVYVTNAKLSLRKQLDFVEGHFAIKSPQNAPARAFWVDCINNANTNPDKETLDWSLVTNSANFAQLLDFAVGQKGNAADKGHSANRLFLPMHVFKMAADNGGEPWVSQILKDATERFVAIELVYSDTAAYGVVLDKFGTVVGEPNDANLKDACNYINNMTSWLSSIAIGPVPIGIQIDSEPWANHKGMADNIWDIERWKRYLQFLAVAEALVHERGFEFTVAMQKGLPGAPDPWNDKGSAIDAYLQDAIAGQDFLPKAVADVKFGTKKLLNGQPVVKWLFARADRVLPMIYETKFPIPVLADVKKWLDVTVKPRSLCPALQIGVNPNNFAFANITAAEASALLDDVEIGKIAKTDANGLTGETELRLVPAFAGLAIYRREGYP